MSTIVRLLTLGVLCILTLAGQAMEVREPESVVRARAQRFEKIDSSGDGILTREEFTAASFVNLSSATSERSPRVARILAAFQAMDGNGDGQVTAEEYANYMKRNGG